MDRWTKAIWLCVYLVSRVAVAVASISFSASISIVVQCSYPVLLGMKMVSEKSFGRL